jgi:polyhydroxyalkanoate synthesis regulator phasin
MNEMPKQFSPQERQESPFESSDASRVAESLNSKLCELVNGEKTEALHIAEELSFSSSPNDNSYFIEKSLNEENAEVNELAQEIKELVLSNPEEVVKIFDLLLHNIRESHKHRAGRISDLLLEITNLALENEEFLDLMLQLRDNRTISFFPGAVMNELHKRFHKYPELAQSAVTIIDFEDTDSIHESGENLEYFRRVIESKGASGTDNAYTKSVFDTMRFFHDSLSEKANSENSNYFLSARASEIVDHFNSMLDEQLTHPSYKGLISKPSILIPGVAMMDRYGEPHFTREVDLAFSLQSKVDELQGPCQDENVEEACKEYFAISEKLKSLFSKELSDLEELSGIEVSKEEIKDYSYLVSDFLRNFIEEDFDLSLSDLSVKEQIYFLQYLKKTSVKEAKTIKSFVSLYGVGGMRTFLSLERGDESLGNNIVAFGQHDEVAGTVFKYFGELLNSAERAEALVKEVSDCEGEVCKELAKQVSENIINRAQKDLEKAVRTHDPSEVVAQIENYVAAAKEYVALLQEVGAGKIVKISSSEISLEEQDRMKFLMKANYDKAYPEPENEDFKTAVAKSLEKSFSNPDTSFRVLRDNGKIVSYNRFDTIRDFTGKEVSYFGSFNADPAYSGVGGVMLEETIKDQLESGRPMMAHCDPTQAITRKYIEDGFIATQFYEISGKPSFEIWRTKESRSMLKSKHMSVTDLLEKSESSGPVIVRERQSREEYDELREGKALTRHFTHDGKTYLVFETLPKSLQEDFTPPKEEQKKAA